ncbi:MAG TPA: hypothetical protein VHB79_10505 [Polyangiaceae bacterium]|nr:hypothetical protein [Polyangiaceae bacterium]
MAPPAALAPASSSSVAAPPLAAPSASAASSAAPSSGATPAPSATAESDEPPLLAADGSPLPQTEERPSVTSPRFQKRIQRLAAAITSGDVEKAKDVFFPLVAYAQVKDVQKPERDYRYRLMSNFERDIREYRKALGKAAGEAELIGITVPEERAEWMKPGKEGNRLGYFRVLRSRLRFRLPGGKEQSFELTSMISWRGEWYVVHLHGFE